MKKTLFIVIFCTFSLLSNSQVTLDYYLPENITYNHLNPYPEAIFRA